MNKMLHNSNEIRKNLLAQFSEALDIVLDAGFGGIKVKIDEERGTYRVSYKTNIRFAKK